MLRSSTFSDCSQYRYSLWREWGAEDAGFALIVGLNPSLADQHRDDPTIRRCIAFCEAWGLSRLCMVNVFAYRSTSPFEMLKSPQPLGSHTDETIIDLASRAALVVAAWGHQGARFNRSSWFRTNAAPNLSQVFCLGKTKSGEPRHPLYVRKSQRLEVL